MKPGITAYTSEHTDVCPWIEISTWSVLKTDFNINAFKHTSALVPYVCAASASTGTGAGGARACKGRNMDFGI
jgi:hypothetical protein